MASITKLEALIRAWHEKVEKDTGTEHTFRDFFYDTGISGSPYHLRYSVDRTRPNLILIHGTSKSDATEELVAECNGIILDATTLEIVAHGMNCLQDGEALMTTSDTSVDSSTSYSVEQSEDGTVLRLFCYQGEWIVATNRRIDAHHARWSSGKTFHDMFCDAVSPDIEPNGLQTLLNDTLDPNYTYSVILLHPENQLVAYHSVPRLVAVSRRHNVTHVEQTPDAFECVWATKPHKVGVDLSIKDIKEQFLHQNTSLVLLAGVVDKRGVIISDWSNPTQVKRWKIDSPQFVAASRLRKNLPTIHLSYLASQGAERDAMKVAFPRHQPMFVVIDKLLWSFASACLDIYVNAFIRRQFTVPMDHPIYEVLRRLHRKYKTTGERVTFPIVWDTLYELPVRDLDNLLQFHIIHSSVTPT